MPTFWRDWLLPEHLDALRNAKGYARRWARLAKLPLGRLNYLRAKRIRFCGAHPSREAAIAAIPSSKLVGYDHEEVAPISYDWMCKIVLWDYPILFWLEKLLPTAPRIVDAGGHMGTKYRAFRHVIPLEGPVEWTIYDLPAIVREGRRRATADGFTSLRFVDDLRDAGSCDVLLASGLLQYLDVPLSDLLSQLPQLPPHLLLNKVAVWDRPFTVTLENFGVAHVPYQIRNRQEFLQSVTSLGYRVVDEWRIDPLSNRIPTHLELGRWESWGYYLHREGSPRNDSN